MQGRVKCCFTFAPHHHTHPEVDFRIGNSFSPRCPVCVSKASKQNYCICIVVLLYLYCYSVSRISINQPTKQSTVRPITTTTTSRERFHTLIRTICTCTCSSLLWSALGWCISTSGDLICLCGWVGGFHRWRWRWRWRGG